MISAEVERTLVKSPPELWAELGDPVALARYLGELGEIRITKAEPEKSVEWEAEAASGKVELKQSGWGTKVTLAVTCEVPEPEPVPMPEPEPLPEPEPVPMPEPEPTPRRRLFARLFKRRLKPATEPAAPPGPSAEEIAAEQAAAAEAAAQRAAAEEMIAARQAAAEEAVVAQTTELLTSMLDRLGAAHHRPFSRA
jgi:hypothetical protein